MTVQKSFYPLLDSLMKRRVFFIVKTFIILLFLFDSLEIYFSTGNFNDDIAKRPLFHGAYNVKEHANGWKRAFIHRRGYFIIQAEDEKMYDFKLEYDLENNQLVLENYFTHNKYYYPFCERSDDTLVLKKDSTEIILEKIDITQLPLMQNEFHWTID